MTDLTEIARVAAGLTRAQREAVLSLGMAWAAGPSLDLDVIDQLPDLRNAGIAERQFEDMDEFREVELDGRFTVRLRACWYFRLTPLGLAVRDHILREKSGG